MDIIVLSYDLAIIEYCPIEFYSGNLLKGQEMPQSIKARFIIPVLLAAVTAISMMSFAQAYAADQSANASNEPAASLQADESWGSTEGLSGIGTVSYDASSNTLTLTNADMTTLYVKKSLTIKTIGSCSIGYIKNQASSYSTVNIAGPGSLSLTWGESINLVISGGSVRGELVIDGTVTVQGGTEIGNIWSANNVYIKGGTVCGEIWTEKAVNVSGGNLEANSDDGVGISGKSFVMTNGNVKIMNPFSGIDASGDITIKGGTLTITNSAKEAISTGTGNFTMTGGKVIITKANSDAIQANGKKKSGKKQGGKIFIKGGSLTVECKSRANYALYATYSISNKISCLKSIKGRLSGGATFKTGGNEYQINKEGDELVTLLKYGAKGKTLKYGNIMNVKFGKQEYIVDTIGSKAFATKQGAKVRSITIAGYVSVKPNGLYGTKSLTKLKIDTAYLPTDSIGKLAKKSLYKAGKGGGKKLTVYVGELQHPRFKSMPVSKVKAKLVKKGLSKSAKVVGFKYKLPVG